MPRVYYKPTLLYNSSAGAFSEFLTHHSCPKTLLELIATVDLIGQVCGSHISKEVPKGTQDFAGRETEPRLQKEREIYSRE